MNRILGIVDENEKLEKIVPSIDSERVGKFSRELAVELRLRKVYELKTRRDIDYVCILRDRTLLTGVDYVEIPIHELLLANIIVEEHLRELVVIDLTDPYTSLLSQLLHITRPLVEEKLRQEGEYKISFSPQSLREFRLNMLREGNPIQLRIAYQYESSNIGNISYEDSLSIEIKPVRFFRGWMLEPEKSYILECERVTIPNNVLPIDHSPRSSFLRCGWILETANIDVGFHGRIMLCLTALRNAPRLVLEEGARISQVRFLELENPVEGYSSQWSEK